MDVDFVAGIHKFIGQATFTTQAAFRSSISSKVFFIVLFKIDVLIFATLTVYQKLSQIISIRKVFSPFSCEPFRIRSVFLKLMELYKTQSFLLNP